MSNRKIRVLMIGRDDFESVPGGDTVQMYETRTALERLGVDVEMSSVADLTGDKICDLLHVFNLDQLEHVISRWKDSRQVRPPIIVSTIFWHHTGHWFRPATINHRSWKILSRGLGERCSTRLYENWQQIKLRYGENGRKLHDWISVADHLLPNSQSEVQHLESAVREPIPPSKITVVPNGIKRELFDPKPDPNIDFGKECGWVNFVLQVGRIQQAKNQAGLIEALWDIDIPVVFVGQPSPYEPEYVKRCAELGRARGKVYFAGPKPPQELAGIYALSAVHVLPSWRETPGLASLEAAASGCRVVTTERGSAREYFGDLAWYCKPEDPKSIRNAVIQALRTPVPAPLRTRVLESYTWEHAARRTLEAYQQVCGFARMSPSVLTI